MTGQKMQELGTLASVQLYVTLYGAPGSATRACPLVCKVEEMDLGDEQTEQHSWMWTQKSRRGNQSDKSSGINNVESSCMKLS